MPESRLDTVRETLAHELDLADAEVGRLQTELAAAKREQKAIKDALTALGRKPAVAGTKKPAPKKDQVLTIVASLLDSNDGTMPKDDLEGLVKDRLTEHGTSHAGFGLRFKEALADETMRVEDGQVSLATAVAAH